MTKIVHKERVTGSYEYTKCPNCKTEIEVRHPVELNMPYCGYCGKIVLDCSQEYCCWCGKKFDSQN